MKKTMLIALAFGVFFSCTEVLEDINLQVDPDLLNQIIAKDSVGTDSTQVVDSTIVSDSTGTVEDTTTTATQPPVNSSQYIGLHVTAGELEVWRKRAMYGPYKVTGDFVTNSPGEWTRLTDFAEKFRANPSADLWTTTAKPEPHSKHLNLLSAAFVSLVKQDKSLALLVKGQLLKQASLTDPYALTYIDNTEGFHTANWFLRLLYAYDYIKEYCTDQEKNTLNAWFYKAGKLYADNVQGILRNYFPNRLSEDYSVKKGAAANAGFNADEIGFVDASGKKVHQIYWIHKQYNNRVSSKIRFAGMVGVFLEDQSLIHQAKIYVKELLKYTVFPDGTMGEYERNGDYNSPQTGALYYGAINIEVAINLADALARKGDYSLYNYTTSEGLYGTEGGQKNIPLMMKAYMENMTGKVKRYYRSVSVTNLIDHNDETQNNKNIAFDIIFSQANWFYKDSYMESCFLRKDSSAPKYSGGSYWHAVSIWWPWSGVTATVPSYAFMFGGVDTSIPRQ